MTPSKYYKNLKIRNKIKIQNNYNIISRKTKTHAHAHFATYNECQYQTSIRTTAIRPTVSNS